MIFLDESGKRWKNIKRSTYLVGAATVMPVAAVVAGAYIFNPGWTSLRFQSFAELHRSPSQAQTSSSPAPNPLLQVAQAVNTKVRSETAVLGASTTNTTSSQTITQTSATTSTTISSSNTSIQTTSGQSSTPTPKAATTDPGNSSYGLSHRTK